MLYIWKLVKKTWRTKKESELEETKDNCKISIKCSKHWKCESL